MKGAPAFILSSFVSAIVRSQAELASIWDYDVSETFGDVDTDLNLFGPNDEPILGSPDELNQGTSGLVSDLDTDLWAQVGDECLMNDGQAMNDVTKRNGVCSNPGSTSQPGQGSTVEVPGLIESGLKATQTLTADDADICRTLHAFDGGYFAVCDSGRHNDRVINRVTGEYTLFHCERLSLISIIFCTDPRQIYCCAYYVLGNLDEEDYATGCHKLTSGFDPSEMHL